MVVKLARLLSVTSKIIITPHHSLLATIDMSKAFDTLPRTLLIQKINRTNTNTHYEKWLSTFLTGRNAYTVHNGTPSTKRIVPKGVPQGSVLSPTL